MTLVSHIKFAGIDEVVCEKLNLELPPLGPEEIRIEPAFIGVCGSELHVLAGGHPFAKPPMVTGHEISAVVAETGAMVRHAAVGDRIAADGKARFVACTLGKTPALAEKGDIPLFVGGDAAAIETLAPILRHLGNVTFDMGSIEGATVFKLISNLVGMTNLAVLAEAFLLARKAGIDPEVFAAALRTTGGWSSQADIRLNWMMQADFAPRFAVDLAAKDLRLSVNAAATWGVPTPVAAAGLSVFSLARAAGLGAKDAAAIVVPLTPVE